MSYEIIRLSTAKCPFQVKKKNSIKVILKCFSSLHAPLTDRFRVCGFLPGPMESQLNVHFCL